MAAPTSTNEVTARKLSSSISALWTKIKSTFQPVADRVTSIRAASSATDTNYPTEKAVRTELRKKSRYIMKALKFHHRKTWCACE